METKTCTGCKQSKPFSDYAIEKGKVIARCRICVNAQKAAYKRRKREEAYQARVTSGEVILPADPVNNFICDYCHVERTNDMFRHNRRKCVICERTGAIEYSQSEIGKANYEKNAEKRKENYERNAEKRKENYEKNKAKRNANYVQRYHSDPLFKLKRVCKERIRTAFKSKNMQKSNKTIEYLNCPIPWLMAWFEYNFTPEMAFNNHGTYWHMDHVIPVNLFDLTDPEQVILCFSWFNLSPLQANENMVKHDSIIVQQIQRHVQNLVQFEIYYNIQQYIDLCARHLTISGSPLELYLPLLQGNLQEGTQVMTEDDVL